MKKIILTLTSAFLLGIPQMEAQNKLAPNIQHFLQTERTPITRGALPRTIDAYLCADAQLDREALAALGVRVNLDLGDILTAQIPSDRVAEVAQIPGITYIQMASTPQPMLDKARAVSGVDLIHQGEGLPAAFTGKDVVVGIIDAGFDYVHPSFYTPDGKTLRVRRVWEQGNKTGTAPEGFSYGAEYTTPEAIKEASYDVSSNSHGTHVAGIAAGNYRKNQWYGVAGDADIVLVSKGELTPNNVNISDAVAYIYKYAESVGKPCVINMSLGMEIGPHDGTSIFDQVCDRMQGPGKLLVGSAGNFGAQPIHVSKTFTGAEDAPLKTMVEFISKISTTNYGGEIDIWGEKGMQYDVQVMVYNYTRNEISCESAVLNAAAPEGNNQTFEITNNGSGKVLISTEINPQNGKPHTYISLQVTKLRSRNALGIILTPKSEGKIHMWGDNIYVHLTDNNCEGWTKGDNNYTLAEIGGTGKQIISVGAYTTRATYKRMESDIEEQLNETEGAIASFSSTGPAIDGRMKPEIAAPGAFIVSAVNSHDASLSLLPLAGAIDGTNFLYAYMQGTSMAAPFVAGTLATWLEARPELNPDEVREILRTTAKKDDFTGPLGNPSEGTWGHGKLDAYEGLKAVLAQTGIEMPTTSQEGMVLRNSATAPTLLFTHALEEVEMYIYTTTGQLLGTQYIGSTVPGQEVSCKNANSSHGLYLLKIRHAHGEKSFKLLR